MYIIFCWLYKPFFAVNVSSDKWAEEVLSSIFFQSVLNDSALSNHRQPVLIFYLSFRWRELSGRPDCLLEL